MFDKTKKVISSWQQRINVYAIYILWLLYFAFFSWTGKGFFFRPLLFIFSGRFFKQIFSGYYSRPFRIVHAGSAMDQPTIGKFIILFIFLSVVSLVVCIIIRLSTDMADRKKRLAFSIPFILAVICVISFLTVPASLLYHYIHSMGFTPKRTQGIIFCIMSLLTWLGIAVLMLRHPVKKKIDKENHNHDS